MPAAQMFKPFWPDAVLSHLNVLHNHNAYPQFRSAAAAAAAAV